MESKVKLSTFSLMLYMGYWGVYRGYIGRYIAYYGKASDCFLINMKNGVNMFLDVKTLKKWLISSIQKSDYKDGKRQNRK